MQETGVENSTAPKKLEGRGGKKGKKSAAPAPDTHILWMNPHQTLPALSYRLRLLTSQPHAYIVAGRYALL